MAAGEIDLTAFASAFLRLMEEVHRVAPADDDSLLRERAVAHLGTDPGSLPTLIDRLEQSDLPNLQLALDELRGEDDWGLVGLPTEAKHYHDLSLSALVDGRMGFGRHAGAPSYVNVPIGVDETLACVELGIYFPTFESVPMVALIAKGDDHGPNAGITIEVVAADREAAARFLARVRELMDERNVYRAKVLAFEYSQWGGFGLTFHRVPTLTRDDVILPDADLAAIEQHTVTLSEHRDALLAAGRHLRRGLLLFGPPGTGKTLSVMYLCNRMPERTTLLLSGVSAGALGQAVAIARSLQPATVVLEDVDLVAMERTMPGMGSNPLLFQLLNEMDGLSEDADVLFILTTNRVELLEPALAARPGRIDQAVEIGLPDREARARLLELYLRGVDHQVDAGSELDGVLDRTEGVSAAFIKELVRRAALAGITTGQALDSGALSAAVSDLLEHSAPIVRSTLGANPSAAAGFDPGIDPDEGGWGPAPVGGFIQATVHFEE